jgi:hypothetical protein
MYAWFQPAVLEVMYTISIHSGTQIHRPYYIECRYVLVLANSGENNRRITGRTTDASRNLHTTLDKIPYYTPISRI